MKDRKQEAIEILENAINRSCLAWAAESGPFNTTVRAEALYDRLVPLMHGEFPEEGKPKGTCPKCRGSGRVPRKPPQYISAKFHDNPCPACDGTGECKHKKVGWIDPDCKVGQPICLECKATVRRRSGENRRSGKEKKSSVWDEASDNLIKIINLGDVGIWLKDNRILPDRRKC